MSPAPASPAAGALGAGGLISAMKKDVVEVRYPKKVRDLKELEARAVEFGLYESNSIHGLLQTPEHARALFEAGQPAYSQDDIERMLAARMARRSVFERSPAPALSFVLEEAPLRRPVGGTMVRRQQLERLLEVGQLRNVSLQVMPTHSEAHPGLDGRIEVLKFGDGTAVGRSDGAFNGRPVSDPKQLRILELRYGTNPGAGAHAKGVAGLHRAIAGRNMIREPELEWFKSSYSSGTDGESCVEVATTPSEIHVRDSKVTDGPSLAVTPTAWAGFVTYATQR